MRTSNEPGSNGQAGGRREIAPPDRRVAQVPKARGIDRQIAGVGRLTLRTKKMTAPVRNELDRYIERACRDGEVVALRLLKERKISSMEFLEAARENRLGRLRPIQPIAPLLEAWLAGSDLRPSSKTRYRQSWSFIVKSLPRSATLDCLTSSWWEGFAGSRGVGNATLNRDLAAILAFLRWARERKHAIPDFEVVKLTEEPQRSGILSPAQVGLLQLHCRPDRWPIFWLLLEAGLRQGEAFNVWDYDIPENEDLVTVRSQPGSKSRGRVRSIPISPELARCLRTLAVVSGGRLFSYGRNTVQQWWVQLCRKAGIRGVTLHGIRATFITRALDSGVPPTEVQKLAGHGDLATTMRYYRNPEPSQAAAAQIRAAVGMGTKPTSAETGPSVSSSTDPLAKVSGTP